MMQSESSPSPPTEKKRLNHSNTLVFGTTLEEVEKDDNLHFIPKFVVECIRIIELEENIQTNGIYRASGKKDSIDKLRKKVILCENKHFLQTVDLLYQINFYIGLKTDE